MVGLLGATELFGRPFKALTWNTGNCLSFGKVIKNNLTRSDSACAPDSGALGKLRLGSGLGGTRPSHHRSTEPSSTGFPHSGTAHPTRGPGRRERLGPGGEGASGNTLQRRAGWRPLHSDRSSPPEAAHMNPLQKWSVWLRSGCLVCKGSLGPPTHPPSITEGIRYCKRHSSLKGTQNNSQTSRSHAQNGFFQRRRIKAEWVPLSHGTEMQMDGRMFC